MWRKIRSQNKKKIKRKENTLNKELRNELYEEIKYAVEQNDDTSLLLMVWETKGATDLKKQYTQYTSALLSHPQMEFEAITTSILKKMLAVRSDEIILVKNPEIPELIKHYKKLKKWMTKETLTELEQTKAAKCLGFLTHRSLHEPLFDVTEYQNYFKQKVIVDVDKSLSEKLTDAYDELKAEGEPILEEILEAIDPEFEEIDDPNADGRVYQINAEAFDIDRLKDLMITVN